MSIAQLDGVIRDQWSSLSPTQRAQYETRAKSVANSSGEDHPLASPAEHSRSSSPEPHAMKRESQSLTNAHSNVPLDEPPISAAELSEQRPKSFQLQTLLEGASPQILESSVEQGLELLDQLKAPLVARAENTPDAEQWIQQIGKASSYGCFELLIYSIDALRKQAVKTRTVIGVVGNTGAGKSSVINAMLDEERLVPTNCMRACTAVVTEMSYNYETEPYRAQIEFISSAEWEKELKTLFQDLLDGNGQVSHDCTNEDTDAGIAYAKIKAVYPHKTREELANSNVATLLREVSNVLGSNREIKETDSLLFYKKLQHFVDSKEKSTGSKNKDKEKKERREMEFWPLIRVVRIYTKSAALATGAVIVDLPGVRKCNIDLHSLGGIAFRTGNTLTLKSALPTFASLQISTLINHSA